MACLRQDFEAWAESEPDEPSDRPSDAEMQEYEEQEKLHRLQVSWSLPYRVSRDLLLQFLSLLVRIDSKPSCAFVGIVGSWKDP